jgi:ring-1,2-phenylacetyl-CoA epoxidase subunit PaaD
MVRPLRRQRNQQDAVWERPVRSASPSVQTVEPKEPQVREAFTRADVFETLSKVVDPEIPAISVIDLGIIDEVEIEGKKVRVTCLPTFIGCPALDVIRQDITRALEELGANVTVNFVFQPAWTTDRISLQGRQKLEEYGLAPPTAHQRLRPIPVTLLKPGRCPHCHSNDTVLESPFGPTLCRATCYCKACRQPFEQFKPL